jgi:hypothetical protein
MNKEDVHAHPLYDYLSFRQIIVTLTFAPDYR